MCTEEVEHGGEEGASTQSGREGQGTKRDGEREERRKGKKGQHGRMKEEEGKMERKKR